MKIPGFSFSLRRALGITGLKQKISHKTGIPTTKQGFERKMGSLFISLLKYAIITAALLFLFLYDY